MGIVLNYGTLHSVVLTLGLSKQPFHLSLITILERTSDLIFVFFIWVVTVTQPKLVQTEKTHTISTVSTKSQSISPSLFVAQERTSILLQIQVLILSVVWTVPTRMDIVVGLTIKPMITLLQ